MRDFRCTEEFGEELYKHQALQGEITQMMNSILENPEIGEVETLLGWRVLRTQNPGITIFYNVSPPGGSVTFYTLIGPMTGLSGD